MPGPYHEIYLQFVQLQESGNNNLGDVVDATMVWNSPRKIADKLTIEIQPSSSPIPTVINTITNISRTSYKMTQQPFPSGGNDNTWYKIRSVAWKTENNQEDQKALDTVQISRPTGTGLTILTDGSQARQLDLTNFELFIRAQGTRTTDNNLQLRFNALNVQLNQWDLIAGDAANPITVPPDSTVIYTCVKSLLMTKYLNQQTGQVSTQVVLFDTVLNLAVNTANLPIDLTKLVVNAAPPPQNGSMPFQNGTIGFINSSTSFAYGWMLRENLSVYLQWNVSPTGQGNLDLQVWWNNSASGQAELIL